MKFTPRTYQKEDIRALIKHPAYALFLDPGLGKTSIVLAAIKQLMRTGAVKKALIVAPLRVCERVWTHEEGGELWKWDDFAGFRVSFLHGPEKDRNVYKDADLYVINYDGLAWLTTPDPNSRPKKTPLDRLLAAGVNLFVSDELTKLKNTETKRFKSIRKYLPKFQRRWGLTGSPVAKGMTDLFGQMLVIDLGESLGQFVTHFRYKYCVPCGFQGREWQLAEGAEERIYAAIKPVASSRRATDHLDLPDLVEQDVWVSIPPKEREFYDRFEKDMIAELRGDTIIANNAGIVSGKCRQIASGGVYFEKSEGIMRGPRGLKHVHDAKTDALVDLVEELQGSPLLVGYEFRHDLERIQKALPGTPAINGDTKEKDLARIIKQWLAGELPVLCGHPQAMGHGLNLQGGPCSHIAWYTLTWNFEHYQQFIARVWRQGNAAKRVVVHRILARKTVDEVVAQVIGRKDKTQREFFEALKAYARGK